MNNLDIVICAGIGLIVLAIYNVMAALVVLAGSAVLMLGWGLATGFLKDMVAYVAFKSYRGSRHR